MNNPTTTHMDLYLDGKPLLLPRSSDFGSFEEFCRVCSNHLQSEDRAISAVHLDGKEVNCTELPSDRVFLNTKRIEVMSCFLEDLILTSLQFQSETAENLAEEMMELSTDCLIQLPRETFDQWVHVLQTLKSLVAFIPKFMAIQPMLSDAQIELTETDLSRRIQEIQEIVNVSRRALESQDVVLFSDTLELRMVQWLNAHRDLARKLAETRKS